MQYAVACTILAAVTMAVYMMFGRKNPMHNIAGPPSPSWIFGHLRQLLLASNFGDYEYRWLRAYGPIYRLKGCLGQDRLMVSDPIALQHVLNTPDFGQAPVLLNMIRLLFGEKCVLSVQGETHKRLRAGMNIGFTAAAVRNYQSVFEQVANEISERLEESADLSVDICPLLSIATLSAVSEGVLGHPTQDLGKEFVETTCQIMHLSSSQSPIQLITDALSASLPRWVMGATIHLPTATFRALHRERYLANEVGERIVQEKLEVVRQGLERNNDIFSRLLNPDPSDKTRDVLAGADIAAQTAIVMIAGQDTVCD
ncbi:cytochrome P450 [Mycena crocata]|nr:cytochrome P450 [Mycena crocata]